MSGRLLLVPALLPAVLAGCAGDRPTMSGQAQQEVRAAARGSLQAIDPEALSGQLRAGLDAWQTRLIGLASQITAETDSRVVREACLRLKIRTVTAVRYLSSQRDPRVAFVEAWIMTIQFRDRFRSEVGAELFGKHQPMIVAAAEEGVQSIERLGALHFPPEQIEAARPDVEQLARRYLLSGRYIADRLPQRAGDLVDRRASSTLARLMGAPLAPISGMQGVADSAAAINNVAAALSDFGLIAQGMPELTRWHLELLMYEANDLPVVVDARRDLDRLSSSFERLAQKVDTLPEDIGAEAGRLLEASDDSQEQLRKTLTMARETIEALTTAIEKAEALCRSVDATAAAVRPLVDRSPADPDAPPGKPLDLAEVTTLIQQATALSEELRALIGDAGRPLPPDSALAQTLADAQQRADATIAAAAGRLDQALDGLTWRGALLIALAFVAALLFWLITRIAPRSHGALR